MPNGFLSGFAQGFSGLPEALDRREALKVRQQAEARQFQLEQQKVTGDTIKSLSDALQPGVTPDEMVGNRLDLFFSQIEALTGPIPSAVKKLAKDDPANFTKTLSTLYTESPYDQKKLGQVLGNPAAVAGVMDAMNRRQASMRASENVSSGLGAPQAPSGISLGVNPGQAAPAPSTAGQPGFDLSHIDAGINRAMAAIGKIDHTDPLAKEHIAALQAQADALRKQREFALTNAQTLAAARHGIDLGKASPTAMQFIQNDINAQASGQAGAVEGAQTGARRAKTTIPPEVAQQLGLPANTTYEQMDAMSGGGNGSVTPQLLDSLKKTESGGDPFAVNPKSGAMGAYQFMPTTVADMHKKGIVFNPFVEKEARAAAGEYINKLLQQNGGDMRKALAAYGGFSSKNPDDYIAKVMKGAIVDQAKGGGQQSLVPPSKAFQTQETYQAEDAAKQFSAAQKTGEKAAEDKAQMEQLDSLLKQAGETGAAASTKLAAQRFAKGWLGIDIPASANYAEASKALSLKLALKLRDPSEGGGLPGSMSNYEDQLLQSGINNIDKLEGTNTILAKAYINSKQRTIDITKLMREYAKEQKEKKLPIDVGDLTAIAQDYKEKHPIFSADDAKKLMAEPPKSTIAPRKSTIAPYSDPDKEKRYQEYLKNGGVK